MPGLFDPLSFKHGPDMKNRFMLAPLTNCQSHEDGTLSDDEYNWLVMRAKGGFGLTMTCAAHVQAIGQGFRGQLGIFSDDHLPGLKRLSDGIKAEGSLAVVQLHHAGMRTPSELIGGERPVSPSDDIKENTGARAMSLEEVEALKADFIAAAVRAEKAGFDGVEIHGAHGYILSQFLSPEINRRDDAYGGSLENRARIIFEIIDGIRAQCGDGFNLSLRLSPERFGQRMDEVVEVVSRLLDEEKIDFLDMSVWDVNKEPEEADFKGRRLMDWFLEIPRGNVRVGVAGKITSAKIADDCLKAGADFVMLGRAAILHHDFPQQAASSMEFAQTPLPVSANYLKQEGLGDAFVDYMASWDGFVAKP